MGIRNLSFYVRIRNGNRGIAFSLTIRKTFIENDYVKNLKTLIIQEKSIAGDER